MTVPPINILIVDDNDTVLNALEFNLKESGFNVFKASDGKEALGIVTSERVDIIVSDVGMPEMDGIEFCENVRKIPEYREVPFIFLTAHGREDEKIKGWLSGADEYVVKPFNMKELIVRAKILYDRIRQKRSFTKLTGNIKEIPVVEILQLFEILRKKGVLRLVADEGKGTISFMEGTITEACWNSLRGIDAVMEIIEIRNGMFAFEPGDVPPGDVMKPVNCMLIDIVQLMDELPAYAEYIPEEETLLAVDSPDGCPDDRDARLVLESLEGGCTCLSGLRQRLSMADSRLKITLAKLIKDGVVREKRNAPRDAQHRARPGASGPAPRNILVAFTAEEPVARCLSLLGDSGQAPGRGGGFSDYRRITVASKVCNIFFLRGENRFLFMWEPVLKTSAGAVFVVGSNRDLEHAELFRSTAAAHGRPAAVICFDRNLEKGGATFVGTPEEMANAIAQVTTGSQAPDGGVEAMLDNLELI